MAGHNAWPFLITKVCGERGRTSPKIIRFSKKDLKSAFKKYIFNY